MANDADVAELADAQDLGSCGVTCGGSTPSVRMNTLLHCYIVILKSQCGNVVIQQWK